jgi:hypothetical protein
MERLYRILRLWNIIRKNLGYAEDAKVYRLFVFKEVISIDYCFNAGPDINIRIALGATQPPPFVAVPIGKCWDNSLSF